MNNKFHELAKNLDRCVMRRSALSKFCGLIGLALAGAALCWNAPLRADEQVPFKGLFDFVVASVTPLDATHLLFHVDVDVHATQLGKASGPGVFIFDTAALGYAGEATWVAASGDVVYSTFQGHFVPSTTPGVLDNVESFQITGGQGRFEGASGGGIAAGEVDAATLLPLGPAPFDGTISSPGSLKK